MSLPPEQEPENYTLDEMMSRLRARSGSESSSDEGQLVTREDGTQVYKVRKRKRRSHQPVKEKNAKIQKRRRLLVTVIVSIVLLTAVWAVATLVYLNSPANSNRITKDVEKWTGAKVRFDQFRMTPVSVGINYMEMKWPDGSPIKSLISYHIGGGLKPSSILVKPWAGDQLATDSMKIVLGASSKDFISAPQPAGELLPFSFRYRSSNTNLLFGDVDRPYASLDRAEATLVIADASASKANLQLKSGTLRVPGLNPFFVDFASVIFDDGLRLSSLRLKAGDSQHGEITITPVSVEPINTRNGTVACNVVLDGLAFDTVLSQNLGDWFIGNLDSPNQKPGLLEIKVGHQPAISYEVPFQARMDAPVEMQSLPFFKTLAEQLRNTWYLKPRFDLEAKGTAILRQDIAGIQNMSFEARNNLRLEGDIQVDAAGTLSGTLQVGVPMSSVHDASRAMQAVFRREQTGLSWATLHLSGTLRNPEDDLVQQLKVQSGSAIPLQQQEIEQEFLDLTKPR